MFTTIDPEQDTVTIFIDGVPTPAAAGDTVAAVILRQPEGWTRTSPISGARRAPFCMMGSCFECLATVDGVPSTQTCLVRVREGMVVARATGHGVVA